MAAKGKGRKVGKRRIRKFVPFGGEPVKDRPTAKESRDEINAIRKYGKTSDYKGKYVGSGKAETKRMS